MKFYHHFPIPNLDACFKNFPWVTTAHATPHLTFSYSRRKLGNLRLHENQVHGLWSVLLKWLVASRSHTDLSLAAQVPEYGWRHSACWHCSCGCTWETPQHSAVPGCRPEGDKGVKPPHISPGPAGAWDPRHLEGASGALGEQSPGGHSGSWTLSARGSPFHWVKHCFLCLSPFHYR